MATPTPKPVPLGGVKNPKGSLNRKELAKAAVARKANAANTLAKSYAQTSKPVPLGGVKKPAKSYNDKLKQGATSIKGFAYGKKTK